MNTLDSQTCDQLQKRLQEAEAAVRSALEGSTRDDALRRATEELLNAHREIRDMLVRAEHQASFDSSDSSEVEKAAIDIHREEHEMKPDVKDILKAIFMWRDDPYERVNGN